MSGWLDISWVRAVLALTLVALVFYLSSRFLVARVRRAGASPALVRSLRGVITILATVSAVAILASLVGSLSWTSGLTISAIGGLAVTLALQTSLGNIIAGVVLMQDRMLRLHDDITVSSVKGKVVKLGLISVWIQMDDGTLVTVSNSTLLAGPTLNRSAKNRLQGEY